MLKIIPKHFFEIFTKDKINKGEEKVLIEVFDKEEKGKKSMYLYKYLFMQL